MEYKDFDINEIQGNSPVTCCNMCGCKTKIKYCGQHPDDQDILIVFCSKKCTDNFKRLIKCDPESVQAYLTNLYNKVQKLKS